MASSNKINEIKRQQENAETTPIDRGGVNDETIYNIGYDLNGTSMDSQLRRSF